MIRLVTAAAVLAFAALGTAAPSAGAVPCVKLGYTCWTPGDELPCLTLDTPPRMVPCP